MRAAALHVSIRDSGTYSLKDIETRRRIYSPPTVSALANLPVTTDLVESFDAPYFWPVCWKYVPVRA